ncbi:uncharacterized protein LOC141660732 [Apium graveolens]|uniref:uncharacterized protein LOC141660732 n=1 Tax=Apium graveolens TaxID=4045 RepID=UPI003D797639
MLAYGAAADQCAEICRIEESTILECIKKFCQQVEGLFGEEYLRSPTPTNLRRHLIRGNKGDFQKEFSKKQEAYRKDVERCFGILQSRWAILRHDAQMHKRSTLRSIMMTCIILHNMIVEDKFVEEEFVEPVEEDLMNPLASYVYDGPVDCNGIRIPFALVQKNVTN